MGILSYIKIAGVLLLLSAIAGAAWYYKWSQAEILVLNKNNMTLEIAVKTNERTIKALQTGIIQAAKAHKRVSNSFAKTRKDNVRLKNLLSKHDLGFLAQKKPGLIQNRINNGTSNSMRCFEIASGAELTDQELNATKPSEINSACPELANPRFRKETK